MPRYVRIENVTRSSMVAERCRVARSAMDRMVGLLFSPEPEPGEGLLLLGTPSIQTWFMRYAIDLAFVDRGGRVTKTVPRMRPWRAVWWARGARDAIELRVGTLQGSGTVPGDQLTFTPIDQAT